MKYRDYSAADFANDSFFIRWVKQPDDESEWFWKSFLNENPECAMEIEKARKIILLLDSPVHPLGEDEMSRMRNGLLLRLRAEKEERSERLIPQEPDASTRRNLWLRVAASVVIVSMVSLGVYLYTNTGEPVVLSGSGQSSRIAERVNPAGQKSVLYLGDGTKVWLNAASKITYAENFETQETRDVFLEGEAFFDVVHIEGKPFVVHTSSIKVKVMGTSFNVKSYADENTIETTLVNGSVRIERADTNSAGAGEVELKPNQRAVFNKESNTINIDHVDASMSGSWKQDRMVFDGESIDRVFMQLERWFDVRIHLNNKGSLDCKLTASIERESLEDVLALLAVSHRIRYAIKGKEVFIEGTFCENQSPGNDK